MALSAKDWATECARQELKIIAQQKRIRDLEAALREAIEYIRLDEEYSDWAAPWNITKWESLVAAKPQHIESQVDAGADAWMAANDWGGES